MGLLTLTSIPFQFIRYSNRISNHSTRYLCNFHLLRLATEQNWGGIYSICCWVLAFVFTSLDKATDYQNTDVILRFPQFCFFSIFLVFFLSTASFLVIFCLPFFHLSIFCSLSLIPLVLLVLFHSPTSSFYYPIYSFVFCLSFLTDTYVTVPSPIPLVLRLLLSHFIFLFSFFRLSFLFILCSFLFLLLIFSFTYITFTSLPSLQTGI